MESLKLKVVWAILFFAGSIISACGQGYSIVGEPLFSENGVVVELQRVSSNPKSRRWDGEAELLTLVAEFQSNERLRVKVTTGSPRWEVPINIQAPSTGHENPLYEIQFSNDPLFSFKVVRKSSGTVLFDTKNEETNFIFADQYLSLAWKVPTENVYGIGENEQTSFRHNFNDNKKYPLWARDHTPGGTTNIYGVHPYYTVLEADGNAHSVAVMNSNAQEFEMIPGGTISYITIGGIMDFHFFLGPTPENTVQQYTEAVGRAEIPPYWGLGFQLCRYGYDRIENMKAAVDRTEQYDIPHDVQYGDIDIIERELDFTYAKDRFAGLPEYVKELKTKGIKFITILDPCISIGEPEGSYRPFDLGEEMDVWVKRADGTSATGQVWPDDPVYFPDYSKNVTRQWWITLVKEFHDLLEYDGLWIDMNEPANFVDGDVNGCDTSNKLNSPPYVPSITGGSLWSFTLCADDTQAAGKHYDTHSMFGWFQSEPTLLGAREGTGKRALVLSRSTFLGSGKWVAHWLGDNFSQWSNLYFSIIGVLQFNQFGIPLVGSDICGFIGDSNADMCQRWQELGAFYPFSRNHNVAGTIDQDPGVWGPEVAASSRKALLIRYTLLPYLYTLFYHHHTKGNTVARALWHEFPQDSVAAGIDRQFLWGSGFLVSPVITEGATSVEAYFPDSRFYDYYDGKAVTARGQTVTLDAPKDFIPLHVHGGNILPTQEPARNTETARNNPMGLIVALDDSGNAEGSLYYDDGDSIDPIQNEAYFYATYTAKSYSLVGTVVKDGYADMKNKVLNTLRILGTTGTTEININGVDHSDFEILPSGEVLVRNMGIPANEPFVITF